MKKVVKKTKKPVKATLEHRVKFLEETIKGLLEREAEMFEDECADDCSGCAFESTTTELKDSLDESFSITVYE